MKNIRALLIALTALTTLPSDVMADEKLNGSASVEAHTLAIADQALANWRNGLAGGDWKPFLDMMSDTANVWYPGFSEEMKRWMPPEERRWIHTKPRAAAYFAKFTAAYGKSLRVSDILQRSSSEYTVAYELRLEGVLPDGKPYADRMAISIDICNDKICSYRQYYGGDGKAS